METNYNWVRILGAALSFGLLTCGQSRNDLLHMIHTMGVIVLLRIISDVELDFLTSVLYLR